MPRRSTVSALCSAIALPAPVANVTTPPEWIQLLPAGPKVVGRDGRSWKLTDPRKVVAEFNRRGVNIPLDIAHSSEILEPEGEEAKIAGWINAMEVRADNTTWGRVDWTPLGTERWNNRQVKYTSPAIVSAKATGEILFLSSAGLSSHPNLEMHALNNEGADMEIDMNSAEYKQLCKALNLSEDASISDVLNRISEIRPAMNGQVVPKGDYDVALNRAVVAEGRLKSIEEAAFGQKIDAAINRALEQRRIAPSSKDWHRKAIRNEAELQAFEAESAKWPQLAPDSGLDNRPAPGAQVGTGELAPVVLNAEELKFCERNSFDPKQFAKDLAEQRAKEAR